MQQCTFKNRPAILIKSRDLTAIFLPEDGGKMASLQVNSTGRELLIVKSNEEYKTLSYDGSYCDSECSAFDDMFPTVDPYTPCAGEYAGVSYPDHGEICRLPFHVDELSDGGAELSCKSKVFNIIYHKQIMPANNGGINITYRICNYGQEDFPFLWAGHIMLQGEDGAHVFTPFDENTPTEMMFCSTENDLTVLPKDQLSGFHKEGVTYKFYYLAPMPEGCFGLEYADKSKLIFTVDEDKVPYLGLWLNNGAFQNIYSITPEPCTVPFDAPDRAGKRGYTSVIPAGASFEFCFNISWCNNKKD